jgi:hypothetical protein
MTDTTTPRAPLGVGTIIGDAFSLVFSNVYPMMTIATIPAVAGILLSLLLYGPVSLNATLALTEPEAYMREIADVPQYANILVNIMGFVFWGFAAAAITYAAYAALNDEDINVGRALSTGLQHIGPVVLCMLIGGIAIYIGIIFLILPGLYLAALWFVIIPAIVIERVGFGAFGRSARLTKEYRWPLVGLLLLYSLILIGISMLSAGLQFVFAFFGTVGLGLAMISGVLIASFLYSLGGALAALTYARLRELKEGTEVHSLAEVFS